jgi:hypothetical protein
MRSARGDDDDDDDDDDGCMTHWLLFDISISLADPRHLYSILKQDCLLQKALFDGVGSTGTIET